MARLLPDLRWREIALGDLAEEFDLHARRQARWIAHLWYWQQVLTFLPRRCIDAVRGFRAPAGDTPMHVLVTDIRLAVRSIWLRPLLTVAVVLTLALTVAGGVVTFGVFDRLVLRPFTGLATDRLVLVSESVNVNQRRSGVPVRRFAEWRQRASTLEDFVAFRPFRANLTGGETARRTEGQGVSAGFFELLGVVPALGRPFNRDDETGDQRTIVLGDSLWRQAFGASPDALGQTVELDGVDYEIVGVAPEGFTFPDGSEFWTAIPVIPGGASVSVMAQLAPETSIEAASAEMSGIFAKQQADDAAIDSRRQVRIWTFTEGMIDTGTPMMTGLLQVTAVFVLLIGCSNIAGLLTARVLERRRDLGVRLALGARRGLLVRQVLAEGLVTAVLAIPGALLAAWGLFALLQRSVPATMQRYIPGWVDVGLDTRGVLVATMATLAAALMFSLAPAMVASRIRPGSALRDGSRSIAAAPGRLRSGLVVLQVTLALPLLVCSGLTARAGIALAAGPQGFDADGVYQLRTVLTPSAYSTAAAQNGYVARLLEAVRQVPGVIDAGVTSILPSTMAYSDRRVIIDGMPDGADDPEYANYRQVSPTYLQTMGIPILSGRGIDATDSVGSRRVSVISQALAQRHFGDESPIGRRIQAGSSDDTWTTIVGVTSDTIDDWISARGVPTIYVPFEQNPTRDVNFVARTTGDPRELANGLRRAMLAVDPDQPPFGGALVRDQIYDRTVGLRLLAGVMSGLSVVALGLSALGIYSLMANTVVLRRRELGIRMALGASAGAVVRMTLRQAAFLMLVGLALGIPLTLLLGRLVEGALFGLLTIDGRMVVAVAGLLCLVALFAAVTPARRATRVDPALVIRE